LKKKLTLGISPCPNDTFIFYALIQGKIQSDTFDLEVCFEDVETLNQFALQSKLNITKLSFAHYFNVYEHYILLRSGSALGNNCGPLLVCSNEKYAELMNQINSGKNKFKIAIPGKFTTAYFLLKYALGDDLNTEELVFSEIENAVLSHQFDAGLIIHESRFTYKEKGLEKIMDLGEFWQEKEQLQIPLGGIAMRRNFDAHEIIAFSNLIQQSITYAYKHQNEALQFAKDYAQDMDFDVMMQHIQLYVNDESLQISPSGQKAIEKMAKTLGLNNSLKWII